jgi:hypothetical protein
VLLPAAPEMLVVITIFTEHNSFCVHEPSIKNHISVGFSLLSKNHLQFCLFLFGANRLFVHQKNIAICFVVVRNLAITPMIIYVPTAGAHSA